jgi:hypothetical protein
MDDFKTNDDKPSIDPSLHKSNKKINTELFDETLRQIEETLKNLGEKITPKHELQINHDVIKETNNSDEEHTIDNTHLRMEELHNFSSKQEIVKKNLFGFYTYLALVVGAIFAIYEILNFSKNYIILKYPISQPYIEYFYEVIEILAYLVMNIVSFIKNLF